MNKLSYLLLGAGLFTLASCSNEDLKGPDALGDTTNVVFNISIPQIETRAYADGTKAKRLQYAVYETSSGTPVKVDYYNNQETTFNDDLTATVNLQLANGHTYDFVFWASTPLDNNEATNPYTLTFGDNGASIAIDYTNVVGNNEKLDAFYVCEKGVTINGPLTKEIQLKRPFAQINLLTNDYTAAENVSGAPNESMVKISNVYHKLDLMSGEASEEKEVVFGYSDINRTGEGLIKEDEPVYEYLHMIYVLANADQGLVNLEYKWQDKNKGVETTLPVGSVPVQRNHRTNIYGALLTNPVDLTVEIVPDFDGDNNEEQVAVPAGQAVMGGITYPSLKEAIAAAEGTEATIYIGGKNYIASEELVFPSRKNTKYTIVGGQSAGTRAESETSITIDKGIYLTNCPDLTLEKIKIINKTGTNYNEREGAQLNYVTNLTVKNCEIEHCLRFLATGKVVFKGCHFINDVKGGFDGYSLHYYSDTNSEVLVEDCIFDVVSKAIVLYSEGKFKYDLTVNNCKFTASTKDDKSAIQMHTDGNNNYGTVRINNTTATNFDDTRNGGLWYEENNQTHAVTYRFDVFVDGELVHTSDKIDVDGDTFNTLKEAVAAAKYGSTITLGCGNYDSKTVTWPTNMELTFTGINPKLSHLSNLSYFTASGSTFHFKDLTLDVEIGGSATSMGFKEVAEATYDNVVFNGQYCLFAGTHTIENSVFNYVPESEATGEDGAGTRYCLYGQPEGKTTVKKCVFNNISSRAFLVYNFGSVQNIKAGDIEMSDCEFNATGDKTRGVLEIHSEKYDSAGTITLTNIKWSQDAYKGLWNEINGGPYYTIIVDGKPEQTPNQ